MFENYYYPVYPDTDSIVTEAEVFDKNIEDTAAVKGEGKGANDREELDEGNKSITN